MRFPFLLPARAAQAQRIPPPAGSEIPHTLGKVRFLKRNIHPHTWGSALFRNRKSYTVQAQCSP